MGSLKYSIAIENSVSYVFENLFKDEYYAVWSQAFTDVTIIQGDFNQGSEITFLDLNNNGVGGYVQSNIKDQELKIVYTYEVYNNVKKMLDHPEVEFFELYYFKTDQKNMILEVHLEVIDEYQEMLDQMWQQAIVLLQSTYKR